MQTKHEIECILASAGTAPNKRLGQNFLIDLNLMRKLIDAAGVQPNDVVLEVGCGTGSFTEGLSEVAGFLVGVEYDHILGPIVIRNFKDVENVKIINTDILENKHTLNTEAVESVKQARSKLGGRVLLVANLPYNVAASIMANLITGDQLSADVMYVTVQKEVAERMAAAAGDKRYGILSILMAATGKTEIIRILPASVFWPKPKVESAMVKFQRDEEKAARIKDIHTFREVVSLFMGHRRKMLKATTKLAEGKLAQIENWPEIFEKCKIDPKERPEKLSPEDYITLANSCFGQFD
ncbi:MAG: 16S rRNA (adenine(1518)-N(6)/adenine(1519)-N(6))-dimethyltransferase RsmA [Phycisphaerae bacterium]|nr:16S rRNA (adenine(1518)-N(6)/adenine(1519)-N(6))-dimethyltransferase RsmA [Phycisphaerae bacterium]